MEKWWMLNWEWALVVLLLVAILFLGVLLESISDTIKERRIKNHATKRKTRSERAI